MRVNTRCCAAGIGPAAVSRAAEPAHVWTPGNWRAVF